MTAQPKSLPHSSDDLAAQTIHDLAINKRVNGEDSALRDAEAIARGCFAFIQATKGHASLSGLLQAELAASNDRIALEQQIRRDQQ